MIIYYISMMLISTGYIKLLVRRKTLDRSDAIVVSYASSVRHLNITLAVILVTFPVGQLSLMVLFIVLGFIIQIPLLGFYAQYFGKKFINRSEK